MICDSDRSRMAETEGLGAKHESASRQGSPLLYFTPTTEARDVE